MVEDIIKRIKEEKNISEEEIKQLIKKRQEELAGLISEEGAAYIVAKDLGLNLLEKKTHKLEIKNLIPGMQNATFDAIVADVSDVYEFDRNGNKGKVRNILLADKTGVVRLSLWNDEVNKFDIRSGDIIEISGYIKEDNVGRLEIRLGKNGCIKKIESDELTNIKLDMKAYSEKKYVRKSLTEVSQGMLIETRSCILDFMANKSFYKVCPQCLKRVENRCEEHNTDGVLRCAISFIIDDGTNNVRATVFNEASQNLFGKPVEALKELDERGELDEFLKSFIGKEFIFQGRMQKNEYFDRMDMIVDKVKSVNTIKEIERLVDELGLR